MQLPKRQCGSCTKCCSGFLEADIHGKKMSTGKPCHFIGEKGCTIYKDRPSVCRQFKCGWLTDMAYPEWMKPNLVNMIILEKTTTSGIPYLYLMEAGQKLDSTVLNWFFQKHIELKGSFNLAYQIDGGINWIGSLEFNEQMESEGVNPK